MIHADAGGVPTAIRRFAKRAALVGLIVASAHTSGATELRAQDVATDIARAMDAERWSEAITLLNRAIDRSPRSASLLQQRGRAHRESGDLSRALADYDAAIRADSLAGGAYVGRAAVRYGMRDAGAALQDLVIARRRGLADPQVDLLEGMSFAALGRHAESIPPLDRFLAASPSLATAWYLRGMAKLALGDQAGACADGREAAARGDSTAAALVARGC